MAMVVRCPGTRIDGGPFYMGWIGFFNAVAGLGLCMDGVVRWKDWGGRGREALIYMCNP